MNDSFDPDPPPLHSARLYGNGDVASARDRGEFKGRKTSEWRKDRLRKIAIVFACRSMVPPIPYSTLVPTLGICRDTAHEYFKLGKNRFARRNRV